MSVDVKVVQSEAAAKMAAADAALSALDENELEISLMMRGSSVAPPTRRGAVFVSSLLTRRSA